MYKKSFNKFFKIFKNLKTIKFSKNHIKNFKFALFLT